MNSNCHLCDVESYQSWIVDETEHFYARPTIWQISDGGHMLIIPRKHYPCLGSMEKKYFREFKELTSHLKQTITDVYQKPISFEHGILGQSIAHAHLQMLLTSVDLFERIKHDFRICQEPLVFDQWFLSTPNAKMLKEHLARQSLTRFSVPLITVVSSA